MNVFVGQEVTRVVWRSSKLRENVLIVMIPNSSPGVTDHEKWRIAMEYDWLAHAQASENALVGDWAIHDEDFSAAFPALFTFLAKTVNQRGEPRKGCRISLFVEGERWKCSLSDPNTEHTLFRTLESPLELFKVLDAALRGEPDWRPWNRHPQVGRGSKKS